MSESLIDTKTIESELQAKLLVLRDGGLRNATEQDDCFVEDACAILKIERPPEDEFCACSEDCSEDCKGTNREFSADLADDYEAKLFAAGFYVARNGDPGDYIIYDASLSESARDYLAEAN